MCVRACVRVCVLAALPEKSSVCKAVTHTGGNTSIRVSGRNYGRES